MDILFWDVSVFFKHEKAKGGIFTMNKLEKEKITIRDVEKYLNVKLRRAWKKENPDVICSAWVDRNGGYLQDYRSFRGYNKFYKLLTP